jgi:transmembrane sensor
MENKFQHIDFDLLTRFLAGEATQEEKRLVRDWKESSSDNRKQLDELRQVWDLMDKTSMPSDINIDDEWNYQLKKIKPKENGKSIQLRRLISIAAAVLIGIGIVFYSINLASVKTIKTQIAQTRELVLPDGSKVTLNAGSKLTYKKDFGKNSRIISLKGEGFFEVAKNKEKPFVINAGDAEIKVLGTSFNVKAYSDMEKIEITVKEGTVSVSNKKALTRKIIVSAGDRANYNKKLNTVEKQINPDRNYISWKTRQIIFENDSLTTIIKTLEDVYHKDFELSGPKLGKCTITTTFENKELSTVLRILESTLDIKFNREGEKIVISGKGC